MQIESSEPPPPTTSRPAPRQSESPASDVELESGRAGDRLRRLEKLRAEGKFMRRILRYAPAPVFVTDLEWRVQLVNLAAIDEFGYLKRELKGAVVPFERVERCETGVRSGGVFVSDVERLDRELKHLAGKVLETRTLVKLANNEREFVMLRISCIFSEQGVKEGIVIVALPDDDRLPPDEP